MMEGHEIAVYPGGIKLEVGWSSNPQNAEEIRVTVGDARATISYKDLFAFVLMNADADGISKLMPAQKTLVRKFIKQHKVQVKKPVPANGFVYVNCEVDVPIQVIQALAGNIDEVKASSPKIIVPG